MNYRKVIFLNSSYLIFCNNDEFNPYKKKVKFCGCCCCCKNNSKNSIDDQFKKIDSGNLKKVRKLKIKILSEDGKETYTQIDLGLKPFFIILKNKSLEDLNNLNTLKKISQELKNNNLQSFNKKENRKKLLSHIKYLINKKQKNEQLEDEKEYDFVNFNKNIYFDPKKIFYKKYDEFKLVVDGLINNVLKNSKVDNEVGEKFKNIVKKNCKITEDKCQYKEIDENCRDDKHENSDPNTIFTFAFLKGDKRDDLYKLLFNFSNLDDSKLNDANYLNEKCLQYKLYNIKETGGNVNENIKFKKIDNNNCEIDYVKKTDFKITTLEHNVNVKYEYISDEKENGYFVVIKSKAICTIAPNVGVNIIYYIYYDEDFDLTFVNVYSRLSFKSTLLNKIIPIEAFRKKIFDEASYNLALFLKEEYIKKIEDEEYLENLTK